MGRPRSGGTILDGAARPWRVLRRRVADRKAELFAAWVAGAPDRRLERLMASPLRGVVLWQVFATMRRRIDPERAPGLDAVVEFRVRRPGDGAFDRRRVVIVDGRVTAARRDASPPTVTVEADSVAFLRLVGGAAAAPVLVLTGRVRVRGNLLLAARLPAVLGIPSRPPRGGDRG